MKIIPVLHLFEVSLQSKKVTSLNERIRLSATKGNIFKPEPEKILKILDIILDNCSLALLWRINQDAENIFLFRLFCKQVLPFRVRSGLQEFRMDTPRNHDCVCDNRNFSVYCYCKYVGCYEQK